MTAVIVAGSRSVVRLSREVLPRVDAIIDKGLTVLVGDANGADKAAQRRLADRSYGSVVVYCTGRRCRNNLGGWPEQHVESAGRPGTFDYYVAKDRAMCQAADYGLFLWDGRSKGTLRNIFELLYYNKKMIVYFTPERRSYRIRSRSELTALLDRCDQRILRRMTSALAEEGGGGGGTPLLPMGF